MSGGCRSDRWDSRHNTDIILAMVDLDRLNVNIEI